MFDLPVIQRPFYMILQDKTNLEETKKDSYLSFKTQPFLWSLRLGRLGQTDMSASLKYIKKIEKRAV